VVVVMMMMMMIAAMVRNNVTENGRIKRIFVDELGSHMVIDIFIEFVPDILGSLC
jgi:hypothetical protein